MNSINFPNYKSINPPTFSSDERPTNDIALEYIKDYKSTLKNIAQHLQLDLSIATPTQNIMKTQEITFLIPARDEYDISLTSPATRIAFCISATALTIFSGAFGALLGSLITGNHDFITILCSAGILAAPTALVFASLMLCTIDGSDLKNTKVIYEELNSKIEPEISLMNSAFKAITSSNDDSICEAFDEIFSSKFFLDRKIEVINSIIESVHTNTTFYLKWRKMSNEIQKHLDDPSIKNKGSHVNLAPLSILVQDLQIPSLTQFYDNAKLDSYKLLSRNNLNNLKSFANVVINSKQRLSRIIETHEFFISESFTKKIEQIKKTVCNTKMTDLQNLDLTKLV
ncbi:MAG: hypothetical protein VX777_05455 [Chlamydiota bacterium]|nr:hypothetical protein [Chlamydiota bacterium]